LIPILAVLFTILAVLVLAVVLVVLRSIAINGRSRLGMDRNIKAELVVGGIVVADCCSILRLAS
jgi:uncharacterized membrane protein